MVRDTSHAAAAPAAQSAPADCIVVLGIGNLLWADEGFGVRAVEQLHAGHALPESVTVMDGGTQGLLLLEPVCSADAVLVFDAIDFRLPPGTLKLLRDAEATASLRARDSVDLYLDLRRQPGYPGALQHDRGLGVMTDGDDHVGGGQFVAAAARGGEQLARHVAPNMPAWQSSHPTPAQ